MKVSGDILLSTTEWLSVRDWLYVLLDLVELASSECYKLRKMTDCVFKIPRYVSKNINVVYLKYHDLVEETIYFTA